MRVYIWYYLVFYIICSLWEHFSDLYKSVLYELKVGMYFVLFAAASGTQCGSADAFANISDSLFPSTYQFRIQSGAISLFLGLGISMPFNRLDFVTHK